MKKTLINLGLKILLTGLEYLIRKLTTIKKTVTVEETVMVDDVQINKEAADMFKKFIKEHTVKEPTDA